MDLLAVLRERVEGLPAGDYSVGLSAVVQHVRVAISHLDRGKRQGDDAAFTDAIYRTNQAFEGSLKEAYRVLASRDPQKERPYDIELFFQNRATLRTRVLAQFTRYRQEWRNPATHDYRLDFDEDEALLAIVSVCAFAIVLVDQIAETLSYAKAKAAAAPVGVPSDPTLSLADQVASAILQFEHPRDPGAKDPPRETEIIGAMWGYLTAAMPHLTIAAESRIAQESDLHADLLVSSGGRRLVIEVKRGSRRGARLREAASQVARYMHAGQMDEAILFLYDDSDPNPAVRVRKDYVLPTGEGRLIVIGPSNLPRDLSGSLQ